VNASVPESLLETLPARRGHFLLESGYHADRWFGLDALFVRPNELAPFVADLAARLERYRPTAVCGPLVGGALLAQSVAASLGLDFFYTVALPRRSPIGLFTVAYRFPSALQERVLGAKVALVDDVISAGSSVRATSGALLAAGASTVAVGALLLLGRKGVEHFAGLGIPVEALAHRDFTFWDPAVCPMCGTGVPLEDPGE
jgi:orotate phosphoribosyltransferase